jgi:hypothetical protein
MLVTYIKGDHENNTELIRQKDRAFSFPDFATPGPDIPSIRALEKKALQNLQSPQNNQSISGGESTRGR